MKISIITILLSLSFSALAQTSFDLKEAIDFAIANSSNTKMAGLDVQTADAQVDEVKSIALPQVNAGIDYTYYVFAPASPVEDFITPIVYDALVTEFPGEVAFPPGPFQSFEFSPFTRNNLTARVDASMLLFDGSYFTGLKAARLFRELSTRKLDIAKEEITAAVTKAYINVLISEENKKILEKNKGSIQSSLTEAEAYYDTGFIEHLEVKRLNLSKENLESQIAKIDQLIALNKELLKFQMAYPLSQELALTQDLQEIVDKMSIENIDLNASINYDNHAIYSEIEMGQALNDLNIERLHRGYLPSLLARANASESLQRNSLFDGSENGLIPTLSVGLSVNVPITDGKLKKTQIQQAEIEAQRIEIQKSEFERGINMQVQTARLQYVSARESLTSARKLLALNEEIYETTKIKFKEGVGSSLEVTQAENGLFAAQSEYINSLYQLLITKTDLDIALGQL